MASPGLDIRRVAVIGAGVSGVSAGIHLKRAGLDVTVYERTFRAGGIWVFDERASKDPAYPSTLPSTGESPEYESFLTKRDTRQDSPLRNWERDAGGKTSNDDLKLSFAPPGPAYVALKNNVSTIEMEISSQAWKPGTEEFVPHHVLADYIQDAAINNGVMDAILFNTRVNNVQKEGAKWRVDIGQLVEDGTDSRVEDSSELFDAVVIASGHYHACNVPDIPGLADWKQRFPNRVRHSKLYRRPEKYKDQNVLIIGAGVSSMDIARDLGPHARSVYQSSRSGPYDLPSHLLPENGSRIGGVESFGSFSNSEISPGEALPGEVTLRSGQKLCDIHEVIVATGYHCSLPFMRQYHADGVKAENATEDVLVTNGQQVHNLHKDIWYIEDPTLAFVGVPYHVATFSLFEFQAQALAAVFSGKTSLPEKPVMRQEYAERIEQKGAGRTFHSLKDKGAEIGYVQDLVAVTNIKGHTQSWIEAYARRTERQKALFSLVRDPVKEKQAFALAAECR